MTAHIAYKPQEDACKVAGSNELAKSSAISFVDGRDERFGLESTFSCLATSISEIGHCRNGMTWSTRPAEYVQFRAYTSIRYGRIAFGEAKLLYFPIWLALEDQLPLCQF